MDNEEKIEKIKKELSKMNVTYNELTPKTQSMLLDVEDFLEKQKNLFNQNLKQTHNIKFDVQSFCKYRNISRNALYKKGKNGLSKYDVIIKFINSQQGIFESYKNRLYKNIYSKTNEDKVLLDKLLDQQIEFQEIKQKNIELEATIKDLNDKIKMLEKISAKEILN